MTAAPAFNAERVLCLARVVEREASYLEDTDRRLSALPMTPERASSLPTDAMLAERVDAPRPHVGPGWKVRIRGAIFARNSRLATRMSYSDCRFSQKRGPTPKKRPAKPECGVGGDRSLAMHQLADAARRHVDVGCQLAGADLHWLHEVFQKNLAGWISSSNLAMSCAPSDRPRF